MLCSYRTPCVTSLNSLNSIERLRQLLIVQTMERTQIKMMELLLWPHFKKISPFIIAEYLSILSLRLRISLFNPYDDGVL